MGIYYVSGIPFGDELYHYRTKGSKNGVSTTPGYKAVGELAKKTEDARNTVQNVSSAIAGSSNSSSAGRHYVNPNGDPTKPSYGRVGTKWNRSRSQKSTKSRDPKRTISKGKSAVDKFLNKHSKPRP